MPAPTPARRRDRHGRGLRGPLLPPILPAWRTRAERFDELVTSAADDLARDWPQIARIQFAVEEVPPSDPAPWERGAVLGRGFAAEPRAGGFLAVEAGIGQAQKIRALAKEPWGDVEILPDLAGIERVVVLWRK